MQIETDIDQIGLLAQENEDENWRFREYLKKLHISTAALDRAVKRHLDDVMPVIDCTACGNCCKTMSPQLSGRYARRLADHLGVTKTQLVNDYLGPSDEKGKYLFRETPCPFLKDLRCDIYDIRPEACQSFPHLHKREFRFRLIGVVQNCFICPIVYNVYERLKGELWRGRRRGR